MKNTKTANDINKLYQLSNLPKDTISSLKFSNTSIENNLLVTSWDKVSENRRMLIFLNYYLNNIERLFTQNKFWSIKWNRHIWHSYIFSIIPSSSARCLLWSSNPKLFLHSWSWLRDKANKHRIKFNNINRLTRCSYQ